MSRITNRVTIRRRIEDVFAVLTDVEKAGVWFPGDVEEHWTSPPPHGVGSTRHAIVRMGGRRTENDAVVTVYDPPRRAAMAGTSPNAQFVATLVFKREGEATAVEVTTELRLRGPSRIAGPFFAAWYGRAWARGLETLKRLMESGEL
jgi:Polyketide cyclase / dehydrase and lipid transport